MHYKGGKDLIPNHLVSEAWVLQRTNAPKSTLLEEGTILVLCLFMFKDCGFQTYEMGRGRPRMTLREVLKRDLMMNISKGLVFKWDQ